LQQQIAQTGQATAVPDVQVDPNWSEVPPQMAWLRSFAGAPICVRDRVIGFLNVGSATPGAFDQAKAERLRAFADQAAVALENARLFSMLSREREQLALLYRLGRQVSESLDVHVVAQWALDGLCAITGAAQGLVLVRAPDDQALYLVASLGYSLDSVAAVRQHARTWLITSLFDWFATRQRATLVNDAIRDEPWINIPGVSEVSRSVLYVPLLSSLPGMADRAVESLVGVLGLGSDQAGFFTEDARRLVESAASTVAIAIANARLYEQARREIAEREQAEDQLRQHRQQLRLLNARLSEVEDAERRRLARELHDQVGQNLSALGVSLSLVQATLLPALAGVPQRHELAASLETRLDDAQAMVKGVTTSIQGVMANLRSPVLDEYGLAAGLRWYAAQLAERTGLAVVVHGEELCPRPPTSVESALFRIAQEALTNVVKHARAQQAVVSLERDGKTLRMIVADDGQGFDPAILAKPQHWGILSMQERAEAAGGCCQVESRLGWGTRVVVEVVL
jgi:signal transduction histidine kinase